MVIWYRNTLPMSVFVRVCVRERETRGHRILLLCNISVRTALLHLHARTHTHSHCPSAPVQSSSVAVEHMWQKYSKQSFIKSSTKTAQCDSQGTNDAWRPLNTPLTDQRPACHTHTHHTGFPFGMRRQTVAITTWQGGTHACSGKHTDAHKFDTHTLCPRASVHSLRAPNCWGKTAQLAQWRN